MCVRYGLWEERANIEDRLDAEFQFEYEPRYNVAPEGPGVPAVRNESPDEINTHRWGLLPSWVDDPDEFPKLFNARAETVAEKNSFRSAFKKRRCLIPANNFYEWTGQKGSRVPHYFDVGEDELFTMAGLWESWSSNGDEIQSVTIITTEANDLVDEVHDRMPVILDPDEERRWLEEDDPDELQAMLDPYPEGKMRSWELTTKVNSPANEGPELIEPVGSEQSGLGQFS